MNFITLVSWGCRDSFWGAEITLILVADWTEGLVGWTDFHPRKIDVAKDNKNLIP